MCQRTSVSKKQAAEGKAIGAHSASKGGGRFQQNVFSTRRRWRKKRAERKSERVNAKRLTCRTCLAFFCDGSLLDGQLPTRRCRQPQFARLVRDRPMSVHSRRRHYSFLASSGKLVSIRVSSVDVASASEDYSVLPKGEGCGSLRIEWCEMNSTPSRCAPLSLCPCVVDRCLRNLRDRRYICLLKASLSALEHLSWNFLTHLFFQAKDACSSFDRTATDSIRERCSIRYFDSTFVPPTTEQQQKSTRRLQTLLFRPTQWTRTAAYGPPQSP